WNLGAFQPSAAPTTPPAAPSALTAAASGSSQVNLAWADNSNNETGFKLERSTDGTNFTQVALTAAGVSGYSDTGLAAATTYTYRVRATNSAGDSAYSNTAGATTAAAVVDTTPPVVSNVAAPNLTTTAV